jgi:hypothetical protein
MKEHIQSLGFRNKEIGVDEAAGAERSPDEEDLRTEVTLIRSNHVRGDDCNDAVPEL